MRPIHFAVALLVAAGPLAAQDGGDRAAFFITLGRDTVAVERYARTATSIEGERVSRAPRTVLLRYHATLTPDGRLARVELVSRAVANAGARPQRSVTTFGADTATVELTVGDSTRTLKVPIGDASGVLVGNAYAFYEQAVMEARRSRKDSVLVSFVAPGNPAAFPVTIRRRGADSVSIDYFGSPMLARVDDRGRILGLDGRATTTKYIVARVPDADVLAFAQTFAQRETSGQAMGQLSPRDTVRATIGTANVLIDYGRPSMRGRTVWGGTLVPWNEVWRTGANSATQLETSADLVIGGTTLPAGRYTLWTLPSATGSQLIINRETGQWGTEYKAAEDVVRLPLTTSALASPVEQFTISIEPSGSAGVLRMRWDRTQLSIPLATR